MSNWAIVIGINQYWKPSVCLKGAVNDAVSIANWLLKSPQCKVAPEQMYMLTRPALGTPSPLPPNVNYYDATMDNLLLVIDEVKQKSNGQGERFFFYFSGHGLTNRENFSDEHALLMGDFTEKLTNKAIKLRALYEYFQALQFGEQFFFVDACRNVLKWPYEFETGTTTIKSIINVNNPAVEQFILFSTSPRSKSWEGLLTPDAVPGEEHGAFTGALLDGLRGDGKAILWDDDSEKYQVYLTRLFDYVEEKIKDREINVSTDPDNKVYQLPRRAGEHGSSNPVLAELSPEEVKEKTLEVYVEPNTAWPQAEVMLLSENGNYNERLKPITGVPVPFPPPLKPMKYTARINVPGYSAEKKRYPFELYDSYRLDIRLNPEPPPTDGSTLPPLLPGHEDWGDSKEAANADNQPMLTKGLEDSDTPQEIKLGMDDSAKGTTKEFKVGLLGIESSDSLAPVELADGSGKILRIEQGKLYAQLEAGFYRARLVTPEGGSTEELADLTPGEVETLTLKAPPLVESNLLQKILEVTGASVMEDGTVSVAEAIGLMASAQASTLVALAGVAVNENSQWGEGLRKLGLKGFKENVSAESMSGIQIFTAVEAVPQEMVADFYAAAKLRLWRFGEPVPESINHLAPSAVVGGLAELSIEAESGNYWLSVELPNQKAIVFSLKIFSQQLTMLVFHQKPDGRFRVFQYFPGLLPEHRTDPRMLRQLELTQRFYLNGRLDHVYRNYLRDLEGEKPLSWEGTLSASMGGLAAMRLGKPKDLMRAASQIIKVAPSISDGYVLLGDYLSGKEEPDSAVNSYRTALNYGLPIFAGNAAQLLSGVQKYDIAHPQRALLERAFKERISSLLWFAWTPETFSVGERIDE